MRSTIDCHAESGRSTAPDTTGDFPLNPPTTVPNPAVTDRAPAFPALHDAVAIIRRPLGVCPHAHRALIWTLRDARTPDTTPGSNQLRAPESQIPNLLQLLSLAGQLDPPGLRLPVQE